MLVVAALALVVAAAAFLVTGLTSGEVGDLYLSMVLCGASLVVLALSARVARPRRAPSADAPRDLAPDEAPAALLPADADADGVEDVTVEGAGGQPDDAEEADEVPAGDEPVPAAAAAPADAGLTMWAPSSPSAAPEAATATATESRTRPQPEIAAPAEADPAVDLTPAGGLAFPIADYDDLEAIQVLPLVPRLYPDEVPVVAAREREGRARPVVLDALAEAGADPGLAFPVAGYDDLGADEVVARLDDLDDEDLALVERSERAGAARAGVLVAVAGRRRRARRGAAAQVTPV